MEQRSKKQCWMTMMMTKKTITTHIWSKYKPLILKHAPLDGKIQDTISNSWKILRRQQDETNVGEKKSKFKMWQTSYSRNDYNSLATQKERTEEGYREGNWDYRTVKHKEIRHRLTQKRKDHAGIRRHQEQRKKLTTNFWGKSVRTRKRLEIFHP